MARLMRSTIAVTGLLLATALAHAAPEAQTLLDEFAAVNWDQRAKPTLTDLSDDAWKTRVRAEHGLIGLGEAAVPDLTAALASPNRHVRALAAFCLGAIGQADAVAPLTRCLSAEADPTVRLCAAEALGRLTAPAALPALELAATQGSSHWAKLMAQLARRRLTDNTPLDASLRTVAPPETDFAALPAPVVGAPAPDFDLLTQTGERVRLADFRGKKPVVVIFALANW